MNLKTENLKFTQKWKKALDRMELSTANLFLTGKAGTGKSTLLRFFLQKTKKSVVVLAPTGVSALNVKGETIHSFFGFKPNVSVDIVQEIVKKTSAEKKKLVKNIDMIVIDEVSMLRADLLDCVDRFLQLVRRNYHPFGGLQMIFVGDLYQLPPVVTKQEKNLFELSYESPFFFSAQVMQQCKIEKVELVKIFRQEEKEFVKLLNEVREKRITLAGLDLLNYRSTNVDVQQDGVVYLATKNKLVADINRRRLDQLSGVEYEFEMNMTGEVDKAMQKTVEKLLVLKKGAQVMLLNNDSAGKWVNGSVGFVEEIDEFEMEIKVRLDDDKIVKVKRYTWDVFKFEINTAGKLEANIVASLTQFPLKLAWAITIHKAQGKTFNKVIVDLGWGSFAHGQTYVALSRCRSFDGLKLARPLKMKDIIMDPRVSRFMHAELTDSESAL